MIYIVVDILSNDKVADKCVLYCFLLTASLEKN